MGGFLQKEFMYASMAKICFNRLRMAYPVINPLSFINSQKSLISPHLERHLGQFVVNSWTFLRLLLFQCHHKLHRTLKFTNNGSFVHVTTLTPSLSCPLQIIIVRDPNKILSRIGGGVTIPNHPNNKNEYLLSWDSPEDLDKLLMAVQASSGQLQMICRIFL